MLRIPFAHLITISGFEEDTADSKDAPALLHFDRRLRLFRLRRLHFLSSLCAHRDEQQRAKRNCAPGYSLHVWIIQGSDSNGENGWFKVRRYSPLSSDESKNQCLDRAIRHESAIC